MKDDDRARAVRTVRNLHIILDEHAALLAVASEQKDVTVLNKDHAQAMLQLAKTSQSLIQAHPGLLALSKQDRTMDHLAPNDEVARALGVDEEAA